MRGIAVLFAASFAGVLVAACGGAEAPAGERALSGDALAALNAALDRDVSHLVGPPVDYTVHTLPAGLIWVTNDTDPVVASPDASRGGTVRYWMRSFPLTLRLVGPDSNGAFAGYMRPINPGLVDFHPNTMNPIPALATHWAFDPDGRTVYYRIDPAARWSDGRPVTADDFLFTVELMRSRHIVAPWSNNNFTNHVVGIRKFDDLTIAIEGKTARPRDELLGEYWMRPFPRHYYKVDADFLKNYNWAIAPNAGPYRIAEVAKGRHIVFERIRNWWGDERRFYRNRFNPDRIRVDVIRDSNVAFQHFLRGELDTFDLSEPVMWHDKARGAAFDDGYIRRITFYTRAPLPAAGMWLNMADPLLADRNVRIGLAHAMNVDKVIDAILRGDYERMNTHHEGYADYTNTTLEARAFDPDAAAAHFDAAGWTGRSDDGVRTRNGQRLSVRIVYGNPKDTDQLIVLREEAMKLGVELVPQLIDRASSFKQIQEKKHQIGWMTWSTGWFSPKYWEFYHSDNAFKPQTNNIVNFADPEMDALIDAYGAAAEKRERVSLAWDIERRLFESGALIPTVKAPYTRNGYWRWMQMPMHHSTRRATSRFGPFSPLDFTGGLFWIDEDVKRTTLEARREGQRFDPVAIVDTRFRDDAVARHP